ncbi:MAG: HAD family phosphatase [Flavobacteriales bacterium]|nr:HAD family phosphatase [Flavobacteriales bacterium]
MVDLDGIKNIVFDLGGVILNIDYHLTSKAFEELGVRSFDDIYSQRNQTNLFDLLETGKIGSEKFVQELTTYVPKASENEIIDAWNAMLMDLPANRIELLMKLKDNYRIFLLSNTNEIHENAFRKTILSSYGKDVFEEIFEKVYLSHRIGLRKPNGDCFQFVLDSNELKPSETLFIDDSRQHIEGAKNLKMRTYLLDKGQEISTLFPGRFQ